MAVGSPALITYSLTVTVLNNSFIHYKFKKLIEVNDQSRYDIRSQLRAARYILQQSQGVPIQIIQGNKGWLSSIVVLTANKAWFERLMLEIDSTARPITFALSAQMIWVVLAYIFTIVQAFTTSGSGTDLGLSMSSGMVWLWMIPVILGWVIVGTQSSHKSIHRALRNGNKEVSLATADPNVQLHGAASGALGAGTAIIDRVMGAQVHRMHLERPSQISYTKGVLRYSSNESPAPTTRRQGSGLDSMLHSEKFNASPSTPISTDLSQRDPSANAGFNLGRGRSPTETRKPAQLQTSLEEEQDFDQRRQNLDALENDNHDLEQGQLYDASNNSSLLSLADKGDEYSKVLGFHIAGDEEEPGPIYNYARAWSTPHAVSHVHRAFSYLTKRLTAPVGIRVDGKPWVTSGPGNDTNLIGTADQVARYVGLHLGDELEVFPSKWPQGGAWRITMASIMAILIQWGTTGSGVLTAYLIPVVGISCRSGGWLVYGAIGTLIWILLVISAQMSARWSRQNWIRMRSADHPPPPPMSLRLLGSTAVVIRLLAKFLAILNTVWILLTSFFEFSGFFSRCWCNADVLSYGAQRAWILVFPSNEVIARVSTAALGGGLALSTIVMILSGAFFVALRKNAK
jgi:hypothetical protein